MTTRYEQAMARIEEGIALYTRALEERAPFDTPLADRELRLQLSAWTTLKDVLELHGPNLSGHCIGCTDVSKAGKGIDAPHIVDFPCPTAEKIIEGVLG